MLEIWRDIIGYEDLYQVSNLGNVRNKQRLLRPSPTNCGYYKVELYKQRKSKIFYVHRLVAIAFIPNPFNLPQINHIDGNKSNNNVANLEWVTASENQRHAIKIKLRVSSAMKGRTGYKNPCSKRVLQYDNQGNLIKEWGSISDVARSLNVNRSAVSNALAKRQKTCKGYVWEYAEQRYKP